MHPSPFLLERAESSSILIYSAATSLGLYIIEFAKTPRTPAGKPYRIFATASQKNHEKLLGLGVEKAFDHRDSEWPQRVKQASGGGIDYAVDCISEDDITAKVSQIHKEGGRITAVIRKAAWNREGVRSDVTPIYSSIWVGLGKDIYYNDELMSFDPSWRAFTVAFYTWLSSSGSRHFPISPNPVRLMPCGLERIVPDAFTLMGAGEVADRSAAEGSHGTEPWMRLISGSKKTGVLYLRD